MELEQNIIEILCGICGAEPDEIGPDLDLFDGGLLDSFGVIQLVLRLEDTFAIPFAIEDIPREKIATPRAIAELVREALA